MGYFEYLGLPAKVGLALAALFLTSQVVGEILELKGKVVPEFLKLRKMYKRRKSEREALAKLPALIETFEHVPETLKEVRSLLNEVNQHYSSDNIAKRDCWIKEVNEHINESEQKRAAQDALMRELGEKLDRNTEMTLSISIENKRKEIIDFAAYVAEEKNPVTKEQYTRIFKCHREYEESISRNDLTNGEVDIAIRIIKESYENHLKNHTFIEDIRGYDVH